MSDKPNILLIVTDQFRYDCMGNSGKYPVKTPYLDMLRTDDMFRLILENDM